MLNMGTVPIFTADQIQEIHRALIEDGCAVVTGLLTPEEVQETYRHHKGWLAEKGVQIDDPATHHLYSKKYFHMSHSIHGMMADGPAMYAPQVLYCKSRNGVMDFCSRLYRVEARGLAMEYGGLFFSFAPRNDVDYRRDEDEWFHSDVCGYQKVGKHYRSTIVVEGCESPDDYNFVVLHKSHLFHDEFFRLHPEYDEQGYAQLEPAHVAWFKEKGCKKLYACAPSGSIILWHLKTIHATEKPRTTVQRPRFIIYGTYVPRIEVQNNRERKRRRKGLLGLYTSIPPFMLTEAWRALLFR